MKAVARLSFWVSADQQVDFQAAYDLQLVPLLVNHELIGSSAPDQFQTEGICSHWFEDPSPSALSLKRQGLLQDPHYREILLDWGRVFGAVRPGTAISCSFEFHALPAGPGERVAAGPGVGHWSVYDSTNGLVDSIVQAIVEDQQGYLWFGTLHGGVCRFDGQFFKTFTTEDGLAGNEVWTIVADRQGDLWFGTNGGVSRYDGSSFGTFTVRDGLPTSHVRSMAEDRVGHLWFGTDNGVCRYDGREFAVFAVQDGLAGNVVSGIVEDRAGLLWFATEAGLSCYDGSTFTTFTTEDGLAGNAVTALCEDRQGGMWLSTNGGLCQYDGRQFRTMVSSQNILTGQSFGALFQDRQGDLWLGTDDGVSRYDGSTWVSFTTQDGLASNGVRTICEDHEGHLWLGTIGGLSRYDGSTFVTFTAQDGLSNTTIFSVIQDRSGDLWFGLRRGGVCRYDGRNFTTFTTQDGLAINSVRKIFEDRAGHLWIATQGSGVCRYDGQNFTTFTTADGLAGDLVETVFQDHEGHLWIATEAGLSRYDGQNFTTFTTEDGLAYDHITAIYQDSRENLWFGYRHIGVSRYDGRNFATFVTADGLAGDGVAAICEDRAGQLWFGTNGGGVSRYDGRSFTTFTTRDGLASNVVWSVIEDRAGHLWFGTNGGGASRYDGHSFTTFTTLDGLAGNMVWSVIEDRAGHLWFGTNHGVTRFRRTVATPPPVYIDAVVADLRYEGDGEVVLPLSAGPVAFEFHGMSFKTRPGAMVYRYRLMGFERAWRNVQQCRIEYRNLPVGTYIFEVYAVDRDLVCSEAPACRELTVVPDPRLEALTQALRESGMEDEFVGESSILREVQSQLAEVARTDLTVLMLGETGTGKGLAANAVHMMSQRCAGPLIQVNCGAIPEGLVESELFGHERGAFTGANSRKLGKVELAEGGTLFLDEIGDLALGAQVKILRLLEERVFERVGGTETLVMDVRIIAATNRNLEQMVAENRFRQDLFFRLHAFPVELPALRQRREDIPLLAAYFMDRMAEHLQKQVVQIEPDALRALHEYDWPGNVRELENVLNRAVIVCEGPVLQAANLALNVSSLPAGSNDELITPEAYERRYVEKLLEMTGWVIRGPRGAAAVWGVPESTLRSRMKKLGISRKNA
ncbi:MAG: sigma 54-interacting transcriptional regulator [Gemmatimonadetes bacterium]|nr:sigma 54-interacting transcriptional regulator [Gemmatimonadota bacterium]MBT5803286.1 sigma 54-interacting transcriptional regulator [Gemmatimonadota bacterium]MBT6621901.1 sigma 54-interacting transcriptional regulator [Gemmatimonadota bacterium]MBT7420261.1 sigma 54-interacting transcriptional regulator [Gemmatimonadota bacterium]MBT7588722.1 sigma 54-interacting transcriptional regulator [Gemmatimonadota bacterium]